MRSNEETLAEEDVKQKKGNMWDGKRESRGEKIMEKKRENVEKKGEKYERIIK